jgi:hypothetical protein
MEQTKRLKGHSGDVYANPIEVAQDDTLLRFGNMISGGDYTIKTWNTEACYTKCHFLIMSRRVHRITLFKVIQATLVALN